MGTRSGDIDYSLIPYVMKEAGMSLEEVDSVLNRKSGLAGISGVSSDLRDIEAGIEKGDKMCELAFNMYVRKIASYIAMYFVLMGGCDAICFTAGAGERSPLMREKVMEKLSPLGVKVDPELNKAFGEESLVSSKDSKIPVWTIPTDEELMIARDTYELVK